MNRVPILAVLSAFLLPVVSHAQSSPFVGRWDFDVPTPKGIGANWLGVTDKGGTLEIWFQPTGGHVIQLRDFKVNGSHLSMVVSPAGNNHPEMTWDLDASGGKLTGVQKRGEKTIELTGVPAPELKHAAPKAWTAAEPLFNGKNLDGWEPVGDVAQNHWVVKDEELINEEHGANLKTTRKFEDFKVHFEVNCPDRANSGFYLRGRYELQFEYEPADSAPPNRQMGSIYGRIAPKAELPRKPGQWETFDVMLVGRTVTVVRDDVLTIVHQEIDGITGGALDANEGEPGPFYIQGDHTGGLKFRNITISLPQQ